MTDRELVPVTQSARAAADAYFREHKPAWRFDGDTLAQAIAAAEQRGRAEAIEEAAKVAEWAAMVPPDGGSPTEEETAVANEAAIRIRALANMERGSAQEGE